MNPTPTTAALAGIFSALAWPLLWPWLSESTASSSVWLVVGTLLLIALPAHAFVVGFKRNPLPGARAIDTALLKRIGAWLLAAALTSFIMSLLPPA